MFRYKIRYKIWNSCILFIFFTGCGGDGKKNCIQCNGTRFQHKTNPQGEVERVTCYGCGGMLKISFEFKF